MMKAESRSCIQIVVFAHLAGSLADHVQGPGANPAPKRRHVRVDESRDQKSMAANGRLERGKKSK